MPKEFKWLQVGCCLVVFFKLKKKKIAFSKSLNILSAEAVLYHFGSVKWSSVEFNSFYIYLKDTHCSAWMWMRIISNTCVYLEFWTWWEAPSLRWSCLNVFIASLSILLSLPLNYRHWWSINTSPIKVMFKNRTKIIRTVTKTFRKSWTQRSGKKTYNFPVIFMKKCNILKVQLSPWEAQLLLQVFNASH